MKKIKQNISAAVVICLATLAAVLFLLNSPPAPRKAHESSENQTPVLIIFEKGQSVSSLAKTLEEKGLIRSPVFFKLFIKLSGSDAKLKAGSYRIKPNLSAIQIAKLFIDGRVSTIRITIPEGYTARQIAALLEQEGITSAKAFNDAVKSPDLLKEIGIPALSAEGFLFPDTYLFSESTSAEEIVRLMTANFFEKLKNVAGISVQNHQELFSKVILASIVEREYRLPEDAGKIARVFLNRLKIGMPLQSCATVVYILTERLGRPHPEKIFFSDLQIQDPYNTYRNRGLPPGPIANPGITSLNAVFNPPQNDYLYFRLSDDGSGSHIFSRSFDEHVQNGISVKGY